VTQIIETSIAWVSPQRLLGRWQPEMFRAEYLELDRVINRSNEYVPLGNFVHIVTTPADYPSDTRWRADSLEIKRSYGGLRDTTHGPMSDYALPPEALLVPRRWASEPQIRFWSDSLYSGGGTASANLWVLASNDGESIAWIERELANEIGLLQLQRAAINSTIAMLPGELLLEVRVRRRSDEERRSLNNALIQNLRSVIYSASYRALKRPIILTGETFEERQREFERFLCEDTLFDSSDAYFVESATKNESSDLFIVRTIGQREQERDAKFHFVDTDTSKVDAAWREWYWSEPGQFLYRVLNSVRAAEYCLPSHILARTTLKPLAFVSADSDLRFVIPEFSSFASAFENSPDDSISELSELEFASKWLEANERSGLIKETSALCVQFGLSPEDSEQLLKKKEFTSQLSQWALTTYRPALAVRVFRDKRVAGLYLLFGGDQLTSPAEVYGWLDDMGMAFQEILSPPPQIVEEAARRESLRRLSWLMHQINGPIGKARQALEDIHGFLQNNSEFSQHFVPDEETVKRRLQTRRNADPARFTLTSRLSYALKQIEDVRRVAYQVKRLKRLQGELPHCDFDLVQMLRDGIYSRVESLPDLNLEFDLPQIMPVTGNAESIREAIEEVLHNACREMAEHNVKPATLTVRLWTVDSQVSFSITDNGLPADARLMNDPFREDASTYAKKGRGSGLGLTIVRETFAAHGGGCALNENFDADGERISGVTFTASMSITGRRNQ
jgi:signal transduction histidine kinase